MKTLFTKSKLALLTFLVIIGLAMGASAFTAPMAYPNNTDSPIHQGIENQIKTGSISIDQFYGRGNALFYQDLTFKGVIFGDQGSVKASSPTIARGNTRAGQHLNSQTIAHTDSDLKPLCSEDDGNIIICDNVDTLYAVTGSMTGHTDPNMACFVLDHTERAFYKMPAEPGVFYVNQQIYADSSRSTIFNGGNLWFKMTHTGGPSGTDHSIQRVQIGTNGRILNLASC